MFKNLLGKKVSDLIGSFGTRSGTSKDPVSTQFMESTPPVLTPAEILKNSGRVACQVMSQVLRRAGFDSTLFQFSVEFHNKEAKTFRILTNIPSTVALSQSQSNEIELMTKVELEMRYGIHVSMVYWRTRDSRAETVSAGGFQSGLSTASASALPTSKKSVVKRDPYPDPVRIALYDELDGVGATHAREGTPSEIDEFHSLLAQTLTQSGK